jgi:hypothetical protein
MRHFYKCLYINTSVTPTNAQFHNPGIFFCYLAPTCFGIVAIFKEFISTCLHNVPGVSSLKIATMPKHAGAK